MSLLPLPISPGNLHLEVVQPALALLPPAMDSRAARVLLLAIAGQESGLRARVQHPLRPGMPPGPARGLWQFEQAGGVAGVLRHDATRELAAGVCRLRGVPATRVAVWPALATDDVLAAAFARLLLWTDPAPLPADEAGGWALYLRTWRPGRPHPDRWPANFAAAQGAVPDA